MNTQTGQDKPWYKYPWPWVAIAIPGAAVIMGIITIYLALANPDYVVVEDQEYQHISAGLRAQTPGDDGDGDP